ncbi:YqcI/YcgG family protein [Paenibacillus sp. GCM10023252]|uniref:YqcI/YcgG family protein n=1 Tax=Paenibacillus sp. GCM10023252 TaxID=3252649 RepID=UPI00360A1482
MRIYDTKDMMTLPAGWQADAHAAFAAKLSNTAHLFPCIPATIGLKLGQFRYAFLSDPRSKQAAKELAQILEQYGPISRDCGRYTSLIAFFATPDDLVDATGVDGYRRLFWNILSEVSEHDSAPWPEHIPKDPHHHVWEYCYGGEQYFMYCATPAHKLRQSRSFPYYIFAITPRWVLVEFNAHAEGAAHVKHNIRERIVKYDETGIHPDLNLYGSQENFEWKQYFLSDDDSSPAKCPFAHLHAMKRDK